MNYFCHALPHLDNAWIVAGTAIPDWLSVADRQVRLRPRQVSPFAEAENPIIRDVARGVLQHLHDDDWFHRTRGFAEVTARVAVEFRELLAGGDGFRCGFLGHIATEMLLDAALIDEHPTEFARYLEVIDQIEAMAVQKAVNQMARQPTLRLARLIELFRRERFLCDYADDERFLWRLNHVQSRVKLPLLPPQAVAVITWSREFVRQRRGDLLPQSLYGGRVS